MQQLAKRNVCIRPSQQDQEILDYVTLDGSQCGVGSGVESNIEKLQALLLDLQEVTLAQTNVCGGVQKTSS